MPLSLWMRAEMRGDERRAPIAPLQARELVQRGLDVTVEHSTDRIFATGDYADAGCSIMPAGSWVSAAENTIVLGLKELPSEPSELRHRHVYFAHAYKGQAGAEALLTRFARGGGTILDLEYLADERDRRLVAFGHWAGYVGAALAVLQWRNRLRSPVRPMTQEALQADLAPQTHDRRPSVLVIGARGRCGQGAVEALNAAGLEPTQWDIEETRTLDREAVLAHDILINAVLVTQPITPFLTRPDLDRTARRLTLIADVTCDAGQRCSVLPIYDQPTTWEHPVFRLRQGPRPLDIIAIDNLPSILPRESSEDFSASLMPLLLQLDRFEAPWLKCAAAFAEAKRTIIEELRV